MFSFEQCWQRPGGALRGSLAVLAALALTCAPRVSNAAEPAEATATLRGRIVDAESGKPTACTVTIVDSQGQTVLEGQGFKSGFRCVGTFEKTLPPGQTRVRISRGFESKVEEREIVLKAGDKTALEFRLIRNVDLRHRGWYGGDSHAHMLHGERAFPVSFDDLALAAQAEDLQYLSVAQAWSMDTPTPERLEQEFASRSRPDCVLTWNLEAPKNYYRGDAGRCLGHCWTLGLRGRTPVGQDTIAALLRASAHDYEIEKPPMANFESHRLIRDQGGATFYSHPARWWTGAWGGKAGYPRQEKMRVSNLAVELPLDTLIGPTFDGLDVITSSGEFKANAMAFELWCLLLNHGYRVAATASSDACFDRPGGATPGAARTYTYLEGPFSIEAVARATAQGRTFATTGPLLTVTLEAKPPGSSFAADGKERELAIEAWAAGGDAVGLTRLELLRNGQPDRIMRFDPAIPSLKTNLALSEATNAWYGVRLLGGDPQRQRAISGAFFFERPDFQPPSPVPARITATVVDAETGEKLSGTLTEIAYAADFPSTGRRHVVQNGPALLTIPGTVRLRAEAAGYEPVTLSPFFDHPPLLETITKLSAEDLLKWETFEQVRSLLGEVTLSFQLRKRAGR